jgi:diacylglycerol kinase (ATP)
MKIHLVVAAVVLLASLFIGVTRLEFVILLLAITMVIVAELINTAIESSIDIVTTTFDPMAKIAKDVSAAAVLIASINSVALGYLILLRKLKPLTLTVITTIRQAPVHVTSITLSIVIITVIFAKSHAGTKNFMRGGLPSGHSAVAASLFTAIAFLSSDFFIASLGFLLALLVLESRIETGIHTLWQVIAGALIGILITVLLFQLFYFR